MQNILNNIIDNIYLYLAIFVFVVLVIVMFLTRPKKVKPIDLEKVEARPKTDIEKVLESLQQSEASRPMTTFEEEQEANAIISYQELVEAVRLKKELSSNEPSTNASSSDVEKTEEISVAPKLEEVEEIKEEPIQFDNMEAKEEVKEETKKFKNSEFISPIFGKDTKSNDEFLKQLKDFRSNL